MNPFDPTINLLSFISKNSFLLLIFLWFDIGINSFCLPTQRSATIYMSEAEGQAPEQTPLSLDLCTRLGVPHGTRWGPPSGSRGRKEEPAPPPQNLTKSTSSLPDDANKHSKTIEV